MLQITFWFKRKIRKMSRNCRGSSHTNKRKESNYKHVKYTKRNIRGYSVSASSSQKKCGMETVLIILVKSPIGPVLPQMVKSTHSMAQRAKDHYHNASKICKFFAITF